MRQWEAKYHKSSTSNKHYNYPPGEINQCKWKKAEDDSTLCSFRHESQFWAMRYLKLSSLLMRTSNDELFERCLETETLNNNESLNKTIWIFSSKHLHFGAMERAIFLATCIFNERCSSIVKLMNFVGFKTEIHTHPGAIIFASSSSNKDKSRFECHPLLGGLNWVAGCPFCKLLFWRNIWNE